MMQDDRLRMKRKDIEEFSDFSLSFPARKIRRLDVDFPPINEESEIDMAMSESSAVEEDDTSPVNEERAIVLFKPQQYHHQSRYGHLFVDTDFISGFKNRFLRDASRAHNDNYDEDETSDKSQAVVCWNPSQSSYSHSVGTFQQPSSVEIVELDESGEDAVMDDAAIDIEEDNKSTDVSFPQPGQQQQQQQQPTYGLHQWQQQQQQQQHCMIPQLPQVSTTPITWFR